MCPSLSTVRYLIASSPSAYFVAIPKNAATIIQNNAPGPPASRALRSEGQWKKLTLPGVEFVRRFLMHVPPKGFVRIRHYGLLCSRTKNKKLTLCRNLLGCKKYLSRLNDKEMPEVLELLYGINICVCKACGGRLGKPQLKIPQRC